ncbi:MAG: cation:proton antiporter [Prevotellaceae bacterium]|nr:cation:proton antiporter [Prevotellaceae bacterium]
MTFPLQNPVLIFAVLLFIIWIAPIVFTKLRLPYVAGLIAAGVVVGPNGFNILTRDGSIEFFAIAGLLYIMFLAGVEVDINDFKKNKSRSIVFGAYTFAIPTLMGLAAGIWLLGYSLATSLLLCCMFASHTLLAYPIAGRYGVAKNRAVNIAVIGTIIADTLALLMLAVVVGGQRGQHDALSWLTFVLLIVAFGLVVLFVFPWIIRLYFKRNTDSIAQYIVVIAFMFLSAFLAQAVGMEPIIGAFLAGIAFNRLIPSTSTLMNRIDFVGNAIFIPIFLVSVGMLVDVKVFGMTSTLLVAATMTVVAIVSKYVAAWLTQRTFKLQTVERTMIFGLSNAHAAASLAIVMVGREVGLLSSDVFNGTIVMILVSCLISSLATERASRELAASAAVSVSMGRKYGKILIPVSNPHTIDRLVEFAVAIRASRNSEPLYAIYVSDKQNITEELWEHGERVLEKAAISAAASDTALEAIHHADDNIARSIIKAMREHGITDVVLGLQQSTNIASAIFSMRLSTLLKGCTQTVFVARLLHPISVFRRIVVAIPPRAEYEAGFARWLHRVGNLHRQTGARFVVYGNNNTLSRVRELNQSNRYPYDIWTMEFTQWSNYQLLAHDLHSDDLFVAVAARKTAVSYSPQIEKLHDTLTKHFANRNLLLVYPEHYSSDEEQVQFLGGGK